MSGVPPQKSDKSKLRKIILDVKTFYSNHFPTDKRTFRWRVSLLGLVLSVLSVFMAKSYVLPFNIQYDNKIAIIIVYTVIALAVTYELYYGLGIGDRKQLTPWILFKLQEIVWNIVSIAFCAKTVNHIEKEDEEDKDTNKLILSLLLLTLGFVTNVFLTYIIASKSIRQCRGSSSKVHADRIEDENIYDSYDNV